MNETSMDNGWKTTLEQTIQIFRYTRMFSTGVNSDLRRNLVPLRRRMKYNWHWLECTIMIYQYIWLAWLNCVVRTLNTCMDPSLLHFFQRNNLQPGITFTSWGGTTCKLVLDWLLVHHFHDNAPSLPIILSVLKVVFSFRASTTLCYWHAAYSVRKHIS